MAPPARARSLRALLDLSRAELPFALLMLAYFFLVTATFWVLKPLKKSLFIEHYDAKGFALLGWHLDAAEAELLAKILNMVVAIGAAALFVALSRRLRRAELALCFAALFLAGFVVYAVVLASPGAVALWSFYLFGDVFSSLMVAAFFAFLNDTVSPEAAKRLYGPIGVGGVAGGALGALVLGAWIDTLGASTWLVVCAGLAIAIGAIAFFAGRAATHLPPESRARERRDDPKPAPSAVAAAGLVLRSPYLLAIVAVVGLYEAVSTIMDFQFTSTVSHALSGPDIGRHLSRVFAVTNGVSFAVQVFLTGFVMSRFGVGTALLVLPGSMLVASGAFLIAPGLLTGSALNTADNGFAYSINQSAREALYVPTSSDEKYQAKAFIDVFVQRFAKTLGIVASLGLGQWFGAFESVRWLGLGSIAVIALWIVAARYAGRAFVERSR